MTEEERQDISRKAVRDTLSLGNPPANSTFTRVAYQAVKLTEEAIYTPIVQKLTGEANKWETLIERLSETHPCEGGGNCRWCRHLGVLAYHFTEHERKTRKENDHS